MHTFRFFHSDKNTGNQIFSKIISFDTFRKLRLAVEEGKHCKYATDPNCEHNDAWFDSLFMTTSVDALIFSGTTPGCLRYAYDKQKYTWVPLFPPQIDKDTDTEKGFAAYGYKNATAKNEYYEFETGADDKMEDYYNVKRYGPKNGTLYDDLTRTSWWEENGGYPNGSNICNQLKGNPGYKRSANFHIGQY